VKGWGRASLVHLKLQASANHVVPSDVIGTGAMAIGIVVTASNGDLLAIPSKRLADFLVEATRPLYRGLPMFGVNWQALTSPALRDELGLGPSDGGVRVIRVHPRGSASGVLVPGDVILEIDGRKVDKDGRCDRPGDGGTTCPALVLGAHHPGDVIPLAIQRTGVKKTVDVTLRAWPAATDLVPFLAGASYDVEGGLVFENLTVEYLRAWGKEWETTAPARLVETYFLDGSDSTEERKHVVVLTRVLADPANLGYQELRDLVVESVNGVHLRSLDDVHAAFAHPNANGAFDVVTFTSGQAVSRIVLDAQEVKAANARLRATYELATPPD
jgi:hypothetical protein